MKWGILFRLSSFWIGVHYSDYNKRVCINLLPCITFWICSSKGNLPRRIINQVDPKLIQDYLGTPYKHDWASINANSIPPENIDALRKKINQLQETGVPYHAAVAELRRLVELIHEGQKEPQSTS